MEEKKRRADGRAGTKFPKPSEDRSVFITGVSGQLGYYVANEFDSRGFYVYGMVQPHVGSHQLGMGEVDVVKKELPFVHMLPGDLTDASSLFTCMNTARPDIVVHLAAMSVPWIAAQLPLVMLDTNVRGTWMLAEAAAWVNRGKMKFVYASSDAILMKDPGMYGVSKKLAHEYVQAMRSPLMMASNAILSNCESPRKSSGVVKAICEEAVRIKMWLDKGNDPLKLRMNNLSARRDWSHSRDVARAIRLIAEYDHGSGLDCVVASGKLNTVKDVLDVAFSAVGIDDWNPYVTVGGDDVNDGLPQPDTTKIRSLGWKPEFDFKQTIEDIVWSWADRLGLKMKSPA